MKVLCIDGGGIRGLIPALVLAEIERRAGRRTAELVDLIAGTSTGGILACGLARAGDDGRPLYSAEELADIYIEEGPKIFRPQPAQEDRLARRLRSTSTTTTTGSTPRSRSISATRGCRAALTDVLVTAYDIEDRSRSSSARRAPAATRPMTSR